MRPGAVIVNVGRGPVIDQQALFDALSQRRIEAVIDTWYDYPTRDNPHTQPGRLPFNQLTNLVMTPHMSGWTAGMVRRRQETIARKHRPPVTRRSAGERGGVIARERHLGGRWCDSCTLVVAHGTAKVCSARGERILRQTSVKAP